MAGVQLPFYKALGRRIREARLRAKLTQSAVAESIGMTRTSVTNIEKGRQPVNVHVLVTLADMLKCSFAELLPPPSSTASDAINKLAHLSLEEKNWIVRVIATGTEKKDAAKISARKA